MSVLKRCLLCAEIMTVQPSLVERKKFCCKAHADQWWKGKRRSPKSEFRKGHDNGRRVQVGSEHIVKGYVRVKIAEPNVWRQRAQIVWEEANGRDLPEGWIVRHLDGDPLNDDPANLEALSRGAHLHRTLEDPEILQRKKFRASRALRLRWEEVRMSQYDSFYWEVSEEETVFAR